MKSTNQISNLSIPHTYLSDYANRLYFQDFFFLLLYLALSLSFTPRQHSSLKVALSLSLSLWVKPKRFSFPFNSLIAAHEVFLSLSHSFAELEIIGTTPSPTSVKVSITSNPRRLFYARSTKVSDRCNVAGIYTLPEFTGPMIKYHRAIYLVFQKVNVFFFFRFAVYVSWKIDVLSIGTSFELR